MLSSKQRKEKESVKQRNVKSEGKNDTYRGDKKGIWKKNGS